jgi:tRNA-(ms[2]io[6]A)-hydroxylase
MLGLKLETDPRWVNIVEKNIEEILTDHAYCEQKAATNALTIMISFPYYTDLVEEMVKLAKEELSHFEMVHQKIQERGLKLGYERKDEYVGELYKFMRKGDHRKEIVLIDRLMISEATHYTLFIGFARKYGSKTEDIDKRWQEWLDYEAAVIKNFGKKETIHG